MMRVVHSGLFECIRIDSALKRYRPASLNINNSKVDSITSDLLIAKM